MKILVVGAGGTLGKDAVEALEAASQVVFAPSREQFDLTQPATISAYLDEVQPLAVVNCAAYADVDGCERDSQLAEAVNSKGVADLARATTERDIRLVHVSTDYVFDGSKGEPYVETDEPAPLQEYGRSKLAGEYAALDTDGNLLVVRTSMLMGAHGNNFANKVLAIARQGGEVRAVTDWVGSPTGTRDLARAFLDLVRSNARGVIHVVNPGSCSRFEQAQQILDAAHAESVTLTPVVSTDFELLATRPVATPLASLRLEQLGVQLASREAAVEEFVGASS